MKISILVPCYNEEKSVEACIKSCLNQTRKFDEIIFIDDCSTDRTPYILAQYPDKIITKRTPNNTGNKSRAQEFGLQFVTGDVFVTTDADTILDEHYVEEVEKCLNANPDAAAMAGYIESLPFNWLTLCRAYDYVIGQNLHKLAQSYINFIFVMPGAGSAFRTKIFKENITFDHDTITEDLDFTYKLQNKKFRIAYCRKAISYTQDPSNLKSYVNQMRRWYGGGWQNLLKHFAARVNFIKTFELSLVYTEGLFFSVLILLLPIVNLPLMLLFLSGYLSLALVYGLLVAIKERRAIFLLVPFPYMIIIFINSAIFLEQFIIEILLQEKNLKWFKPERFFYN